MLRVILLGSILIISQSNLVAYASGINYKIFAIQSDGFYSRLWDYKSTPPGQFEDRLRFLNNIEGVDERYLSEKEFYTAYENFDKQMQDLQPIWFKQDQKENFQLFAQDCLEVFKSGNLKTRVAIFLLFEDVSSRHIKFISALKRKKERMANIPKPQVDPEKERRLFEIFINADQGGEIPLDLKEHQVESAKQLFDLMSIK